MQLSEINYLILTNVIIIKIEYCMSPLYWKFMLIS